jgi:hypothetical protein
MNTLQARPERARPEQVPESAGALRPDGARTEPDLFGESMVVRWREKGRGIVVNKVQCRIFAALFDAAIFGRPMISGSKIRARNWEPNGCGGVHLLSLASESYFGDLRGSNK